MKAIKILLSITIGLVIPVSFALSQQDSLKSEGITIIVPKKQLKIESYIFISGGYQFPAWIRVPMLPENSPGLKKRGNMDVKVPGWSTGIGIMKNVNKHFEVGILADFYRSVVPVTYSGQRSTSNWVYEQSFNTNYYTEVFSSDIERVNEVYSFRATIRYKIPAGNFHFWGGLCAGTFSSKVEFSEEKVNDPHRIYMENLLGLTFQTGINYISKNKKKQDIMNYTLFFDFSGPRIEENFISLFNPGWMFNNSKGNYVINPFRIGLAIGVHL